MDTFNPLGIGKYNVRIEITFENGRRIEINERVEATSEADAIQKVSENVNLSAQQLPQSFVYRCV